MQHVSHVPVGTVSPQTVIELVDWAETNKVHVTGSETHLGDSAQSK